MTLFMALDGQPGAGTRAQQVVNKSLRIASESYVGASTGRQRNSTSHTCSWAAVMIDWQHGAGHFNP